MSSVAPPTSTRKKRTIDEITPSVEAAAAAAAGVSLVDIPPPPMPPPVEKHSRAPDVTEEEPSEEQSLRDEIQTLKPVQEVKRSPFVIYPDEYAKFDPKRIVFSKEPQNSKEGGGMILFMNYVYIWMDPETGTEKTAVKPLLVNTPNGMHLPSGMKPWKDGKISTLMSCGRDWEANPYMKQFNDIMTMIVTRCIEAIIEKKWNDPFPNTPEKLMDNFTPPLFIGMSPEGKQYPPSMKVSIIISTTNKTEMYKYAPKPPLQPLLAADVIAGSSATAIIHIPWVYRRKVKGVWNYSIRINGYQLVIEAPAGKEGAQIGSGGDTCSVSF